MNRFNFDFEQRCVLGEPGLCPATPFSWTFDSRAGVVVTGSILARLDINCCRGKHLKGNVKLQSDIKNNEQNRAYFDFEQSFVSGVQ